ncbi:hypothetical protein M407DRAFT_241892 [Tulasnella calospora MUT 4182]|uniref:Succinate dehydrogenase cytochrome b560 subunit n=1 Tax=Tulasnella calospora MUT 4182 TaxID=1051891 RepID=A0A0C3QH95_9AGAM|nr:hypothetical protein M407DRAFT_241892 [Tulasnella calospora MUT 4182]
MQSSKVVGLGLRLGTRARPSGLIFGSVQSPFLAKGSIRTVLLKPTPASAATKVLNSQRLKRPSSPHFTIYKPQMTWIPHITNRIFGGALSGLLYVFSIAYLAGPSVGLPFDGASIVELVHSLPEWAKLSGKTLLAAPFAFHFWMGVRHLAWDVIKLTSVKQVTRTGYVAIAAAAVSTAYLVSM